MTIDNKLQVPNQFGLREFIDANEYQVSPGENGSGLFLLLNKDLGANGIYSNDQVELIFDKEKLVRSRRKLSGGKEQFARGEYTFTFLEKEIAQSWAATYWMNNGEETLHLGFRVSAFPTGKITNFNHFLHGIAGDKIIVNYSESGRSDFYSLSKDGSDLPFKTLHYDSRNSGIIFWPEAMEKPSIEQPGKTVMAWHRPRLPRNILEMLKALSTSLDFPRAPVDDSINYKVQ